MKEVVDWLICIEEMAGKFYHDAAAYFDDPDLVAFLEQSARDEAQHVEIMTSASKILEKHPEIKSAFAVDQQLRDSIETPLRQNQTRLKSKTLSQKQLVDCIIAVELSEWNDIFLSVVNALKKIDPRFKCAAFKIQRHLNRMEHYVATSGSGRQKIETLKGLKPVWRERILIIEDDAYLAGLLERVLHPEGRIDLASDGEAGLKKIRKNYYRLIVSDVNMPGMDGISLYRRAAAEFPNIGDRYLFLTGNPDPQFVDFFKKAKLRYLNKPASIYDVQSSVHEILHKSPCN